MKSIAAWFTLVLTILFLSACGGGGDSTGIYDPIAADPIAADPIIADPIIADPIIADPIIADPDVVFSTQNVTVSVVVSEIPDASYNLNYDTILYAAPALHFTPDIQGNNLVYFWPSYNLYGPEFPGVEFTETSPDTFTVTRHLLDAVMGFARSFTPMDVDDPTIKRFAIADHGLEMPSETNENFQFGYVWVATDYGNGFEFEQITEYRAFNHNIAAYDIDNNGYDDLVVVNMGVKEGGKYVNDSLHTFSQYSSGQFEQIDAFNREGLPVENWLQIGTAGSTTFADLNNDGIKELIQGAYTVGDWPEFNWGAIRIWKLNNYGEYQEANVIEREGLFDPNGLDFGAAGIFTIDYDNDGLLDIVAFVEDNQGVDGAGIEIYRNNGNFQFTRVTDEVFPNNFFDPADFNNRELVIVDINNDGLDDIVLNPMFHRTDLSSGPVSENPHYQNYNIGAAIFLNTGSKFVRQIDNPTYNILIGWPELPVYLRFMDVKNGIARFFGLTPDGAPVVLKVQY